jgi:PAS domain S-box-containing protein
MQAVRAGGLAAERVQVVEERVIERSASFAPDPRTPAAARQLLREVLEECGPAEWRDAAEVALSELATNAILHAHTAVTVHVRCTATELRVEVGDESSIIPQQRVYAADATTGRGLGMVAALTDAHGIVRSPSGKVVWFCLGRQPAVPSADAGAMEIEALLDAWGDEKDYATSSPGADATSVVRLLAFPPMLWLAAIEMHDGLLRELALFRAGRGQDTADLVRADRARFRIRDALTATLREGRPRGETHVPLPPGHPSSLEEVPPVIDLEVPLWAEAAADCAVFQDLLDEANRLAAQGELLIQPTLPEVIALRDWAAEQIISAAAGQSPMPWPGADAEHFAQQLDEAVREFDYDVAAVVNGARTAICVDAQNRILGISAALAREIGWDVGDLVGRRVVAIVPPRYREAHVAGLTRHLSTGQAHALRIDLHLPVLRSDGTEVMCDFWIDADRSRSGRPVYIAYISPTEGPTTPG